MSLGLLSPPMDATVASRSPNHLATQASVRQTLDKFVALFGAPIDLWVFADDAWHHPVDVDSCDQLGPLLEVAVIGPESLPSAPDSIHDPVVQELSPTIFLIGTPVLLPRLPTAAGCCRTVAWGTVQTTSSRLISTLLQLSRETVQVETEVEELREGVMPHLEQITSDFEELTYLRRLNQHVVCQDELTNPIVALAQYITLELMPLVKAEGLGFVPAVLSKRGNEAAQLTIGAPLVWSGRCVADSRQLADMIDNLRGDSPAGETVVCNHIETKGRHAQFGTIRSCIQVPVVHQGHCYGWLVALNRIPPAVPSGPYAIPVLLGESDFGTSEAGLMNVAANTLSAHCHTVEQMRQKEQLLIGIVRSLISTLDARDPYTCGHSDRVAIIARCIGERLQLGQKPCDQLYLSGLLHDLGKIGVPDEVLHKPGKLTEEEFAIIRKHPRIGYEILKHLPQLQHVLPGVLHHHEAVNGSGYPDGLCGNAIPLFARILAIADAYDAMTSARPYRAGMEIKKALGILADGAGTQWDEEIVRVFLSAHEEISVVLREASQFHDALLKPADWVSITSGDCEMDAILLAISAMNSRVPSLENPWSRVEPVPESLPSRS